MCGEAGDAEHALQAIARLKPDLVLVDITLPGKSGLELIKELRSRNSEVKMLVVSMHDEALYADRVLRAGGDGYIMKQEDPEEIVHAIRDVLGGHIYVSEEVLAGTTKGPSKPAAPSRKTPARWINSRIWSSKSWNCWAGARTTTRWPANSNCGRQPSSLIARR